MYKEILNPKKNTRTQATASAYRQLPRLRRIWLGYQQHRESDGLGLPLAEPFTTYIYLNNAARTVHSPPNESSMIGGCHEAALYEAQFQAHLPSLVRLKELRKVIRDDHHVVFTHGNLERRNIMVRVNGTGDDEVEVVILDWELAGWRPAFWEGMLLEWSASMIRIWQDLRPLVQVGFEADVEREVQLRLVNGGMSPVP
ncbi:hypothetical protein D9758_008779 [Tetrapyrgos nigripes]|uniref:Aminoglycoside phosphotransferase domain-containing protein n=1 Tax=Tetrapyrgos nigripes TaxID=182062 RepID=A0A8H5D3V2_9AGAR|nr:hypothetical protein D9758_008779 [Tetrapyrgos nigripes]